MKTELAIIAAIILTMMAGNAYALETSFNGWLYSGQTITVKDERLIVYETTTGKDAIVEYSGGNLYVTNNSCQQTQTIRLCIDHIEYYLAAKQDRLKVRAISLSPDISITRTAAKNEFEAGSGTEITVKITNNGGLAQNLTYTEDFPAGIRVTETSFGLEPKGSSIEWKTANLKETKSESFSYKIAVDDVIDREFTATLTYFDGKKTKTLRTSSAKIKTTPRLIQAIKLGVETSRIGQENNITLSFTNKETKTAKIKVQVATDSGIIMTKLPEEFKKISDTGYEGNIEMKKGLNVTNNITKNYVLKFEGNKEGTVNLIAQAKYSTSDFTDRELPELKKKVTIESRGIKVRTNLNDLEIEANQQKTLRIWLQNLNPESAIRKVLILFTSDGLVELPDEYIEEIPAQEHKKIAEKTFYAPDINTSKGYKIEANVTYITEFGQEYSKKFTFTQTVEKIAEISITKTTDRDVLENGQETTVTVKVKNPRKTKLLGITVKDAVPEEFTVTGQTSATLTLASGDEQTAYTYIIKAPRLTQEKKYELNTTATYSDANAADKYKNQKSYTAEKSRSVTVKPQKFELSATRKTEGENLYKGETFKTIYTINNPSTDTTAEDIVINIPLQPEFDLAGKQTQASIGKLEPGEQAVIETIEKRRIKKTGSLTLQKARITYSNQFGEHFEINTSETPITIQSTTQTDLPYISLTKNAPATANNTDFFEVKLAASNEGKTIESIEIEDGEIIRAVAIKNGSNYTTTYTKRITTPGKYKLGKATATYKIAGTEYLTASEEPEITIIENPSVAIEKTAPKTANNRENFEVKLTIKPLLEAITNLTIQDNGKTFHYPRVENETTETYTKSIQTAGTTKLPAAKATYTNKGETYSTSSNEPEIAITEINLLSIEKTASTNATKAGEEIEITLKIKNKADDELPIVIADQGKAWALTLAPTQEKTLTHKTKAEKMTPATANYTYNGETFTAESNTPELTITGEAEKEKLIKEEGGIIQKMGKFLLSIITWQRG
ncbi:DUF11 domain-containing protein [Candidatus Woesearchaeota archaeon]|nr:DUF11 domain-containing protein [Candidatus Woesearchaeota archaeon]